MRKSTVVSRQSKRLSYPQLSGGRETPTTRDYLHPFSQLAISRDLTMTATAAWQRQQLGSDSSLTATAHRKKCLHPSNPGLPAFCHGG